MALNVKEDEEKVTGQVDVGDIESGDSLGDDTPIPVDPEPEPEPEPEPKPEPEPVPTQKVYLFKQDYAVCSYDDPTVLKNPVFKCELTDWFDNDKTIRIVGDVYVLGKPDEQDMKNNEAYYALQNKISEEKKYLSDTDYVCFEIVEGAAKKDDKQKVLDKRAATRDQMWKDEEELSKMKLVDLGTEVQYRWIDNKGNPAKEPVEPPKDDDEKEGK